MAYREGMLGRRTSRFAATLVVVVFVAAPVPAGPGGGVAVAAQGAGASEAAGETSLQRDARELAEKRAREEAQVEADRQRRAAGGELDRQWNDAVERAKMPSLRDLVSMRLMALVVGLAWLRLEWRRQRRASRARP